ncbi:hypothetical protein [Parabacteroides timonensis]|uniref:hypothetical protein n=1 Tax=Parabacteroides timonensis TaxID=1871013 RepID=UPI00094E36FF|nr:hypothetical protein [Parabacteroides timonensis]
MNKFKFVQLCGIVMLLLMAACTDVDITMPKGLKGDTGLSAYEFWMEKVADGTIDWPKDQTGVADFFKYLKGKDGNDGKDGQSAFDQWKDMIADGSVDDPHNPGNKWPAENNTVQDFWRFLTGASGENGQVPHIGDNGHWFIGNEDTGVTARGQDGKSSVPTIGENGNWYIDGKDTGKPAFGGNGRDGKDGKDGKDGTNGKSAYELWKEYISSGNVDNPHDPDQKWPAGRNKQTDFWDFLTGKSSTEEIEIGKYNVIPQYWNSDLREYVTPTDGSVLFTVYDKRGNKVPAGIQVSGLPGIDASTTFTTDAEGQFKVTWDKLPDNKAEAERKGCATVLIDGVQETSAENTLVPNRVNVRGVFKDTRLVPNLYSDDINEFRRAGFGILIERQIDGVWSRYPVRTIGDPVIKSGTIKDLDAPVSAENVDRDKSFTWRPNIPFPEGIVLIRPIVLTEAEKSYAGEDERIKVLLPYAWDGTPTYIACYFGDGEGPQNDYGQIVYMEQKFHLPEVYPAPGFKKGSVFVDIKEGVTTLWGEVDTDDMPEFYKTQHYIPGDFGFAQKEGTDLWEPVDGKCPASELAADRVVYIRMSTSLDLTGGFSSTQTRLLSEGGSRFKLESSYPGNWIGLDIRRQKPPLPEKQGCEYRGRYAYKFVKEGENYFLVDYADPSKRMKVERQTCPDDWAK